MNKYPTPLSSQSGYISIVITVIAALILVSTTYSFQFIEEEGDPIEILVEEVKEEQQTPSITPTDTPSTTPSQVAIVDTNTQQQQADTPTPTQIPEITIMHTPNPTIVESTTIPTPTSHSETIEQSPTLVPTIQTSVPTPTPSDVPTEPTNTPVPNSPTPTPTIDMTPVTFPDVNSLALGTCSKEVHDKYFVTGPDGNKYRTWHPIQDPSGCIFAHEHGDPPHPSSDTPPFGYVALIDNSTSNISDHTAYKCFTHYSNGNNGWGYAELDYGGLPIDFTVCVHQGTSNIQRVSKQYHDFWFWSKYQGNETLLTVMANTGSAQSPCYLGEQTTGAAVGRQIAADDCHTNETWTYAVNVGNAWTTSNAAFAVVNPPTLLVGGGTLSGLLMANCSENYDPASICSLNQIGLTSSFFLGNMRILHNPAWEWSNSGGTTQFCTDSKGTRQVCSSTTITQTVPTINVINQSPRILDRTGNSDGFAGNQDILWTVGVPGGN